MAAVVAGGLAVFAGSVASVMIYYWYRLPSLIGFSMFPDGDEMLVDLRHPVPLSPPRVVRHLDASSQDW